MEIWRYGDMHLTIQYRTLTTGQTEQTRSTGQIQPTDGNNLKRSKFRTSNPHIVATCISTKENLFVVALIFQS